MNDAEQLGIQVRRRKKTLSSVCTTSKNGLRYTTDLQVKPKEESFQRTAGGNSREPGLGKSS